MHINSINHNKGPYLKKENDGHIKEYVNEYDLF